jgi:hypothetical protein
MSDSRRDQGAPEADSADRPTAQEALQGRKGSQMLVVLCTSVTLLVSPYVAMLAFASE